MLGVHNTLKDFLFWIFIGRTTALGAMAAATVLTACLLALAGSIIGAAICLLIPGEQLQQPGQQAPGALERALLGGLSGAFIGTLFGIPFGPIVGALAWARVYGRLRHERMLEQAAAIVSSSGSDGSPEPEWALNANPYVESGDQEIMRVLRSSFEYENRLLELLGLNQSGSITVDESAELLELKERHEAFLQHLEFAQEEAIHRGLIDPPQ